VQFATEDKVIVAHLLAHQKPIDLYDVHREYLLSPIQIGAALSRLIAADIIVREGQMIFLTDGARQRIWKLRFEIYNRPKHWRALKRGAPPNIGQ
jgi:hypothetical protein